MDDSSDQPLGTRPTRRLEPDAAPQGTFVKVFGECVFLTHAAPQRGVLKIGRSDDCDIVVKDHSVSRLHAILHFGESVHIEDAGSTNGTRVGARALRAGQRCALPPGQLAELGAALVVIARGADDVVGVTPLPPPVVADASDGVVVADEAMLALYRKIERVASGEINVLLTGETGVGKAVIAERLHRSSPRRDQPLVRLDWAASAEPLLASELFGHGKAAFPGAGQARAGLLEIADGGTVFLDEVGDMGPAIQARLLRVLDERHVRRIGAVRARPINVRFVTATSRNLEDEVAHGRFRRDLYHRLGGVVLAVPPLRERQREIVALVERYVERAAAALNLSAPRVTPDAMAALGRHPWPGNVRELKTVVERAVSLVRGEPIDVAALGLGEPARPRTDEQPLH